MDLLIILTYVAFAWALFKIFKIPVNKWTIPTAALGGIFIVSGLILLMNYNHPYTFKAQKSGGINSCCSAGDRCGNGSHGQEKYPD